MAFRNAAKKANADIVVICSSDDEYPVITKEIVDGLKGQLSIPDLTVLIEKITLNQKLCAE